MDRTENGDIDKILKFVLRRVIEMEIIKLSKDCAKTEVYSAGIVWIFSIIEKFNYLNHINIIIHFLTNVPYNHISLSVFYALGISIKTIILIFSFIWVRASFPRIRYDQLMSFCWTKLLPLIIAIIIIMPCVIYFKESTLYNLWLL